MLRRSPRAFALRVFAVLLAALTARVVATDLSTLHRRARDLGPIVSAVVASRDLAFGAVLKSADLAQIERHESQLADGTLLDRNVAIGRTLAVGLVAGAAVQADALVPAERRGASAFVPVGFRAVRVVTDDGLRPLIGSAVDVFAVIDPTFAEPEIGTADRRLATAGSATTVARAALVLAVDAANDDTRGGSTVGVLLRVSEAEARQIAFASASGVVTLALDPPEDACCSTSDSEPHS